MVIGIGGRSRSGKTTLAEALVWHQRTQNKRAIALHQDDFVKRLGDIPLIQGETDWETPDSIDFELLKKTVLFLKTDFDFIIIEGFLAFADSQLNALYDRCFFTVISEETFKIRKANDDRWGAIPDWYVNHIWESFLNYGQPPVDLPPLMEVNGEKPYNMGEILTFMRPFGE
ncbi:MAG: hypothetical protein R2822_01930 [Spirosomataceae bacterium]